MPLQICSNRQFCAPSAAAGVAVVTTGVAWTNSGYTEIVPNTSSEIWVMTGVVMWSTDSNVSSDDTEFDIAIGAAASEVVVATIRCRHNQQGAVIAPQQFRFMIPIDGVTGRVSVRVRVSHTRTTTWNVSILYLKNPINGTLLITRSPSIVYPPATNSISFTTAGTAWLNTGSFTTIVASLASDFVLTHVVSELIQTGAEGEIDIAIGAAASEVVVTTFPITARSAHNVSGAYYELPNSLDVFPAGTRISYRARSGTASEPITAALIGHVKPL